MSIFYMMGELVVKLEENRYILEDGISQGSIDDETIEDLQRNIRNIQKDLDGFNSQATAMLEQMGAKDCCFLLCFLLKGSGLWVIDGYKNLNELGRHVYKEFQETDDYAVYWSQEEDLKDFQNSEPKFFEHWQDICLPLLCSTTNMEVCRVNPKHLSNSDDCAEYISTVRCEERRQFRFDVKEVCKITLPATVVQMIQEFMGISHLVAELLTPYYTLQSPVTPDEIDEFEKHLTNETGIEIQFPSQLRELWMIGDGWTRNDVFCTKKSSSIKTHLWPWLRDILSMEQVGFLMKKRINFKFDDDGLIDEYIIFATTCHSEPFLYKKLRAQSRHTSFMYGMSWDGQYPKKIKTVGEDTTVRIKTGQIVGFESSTFCRIYGGEGIGASLSDFIAQEWLMYNPKKKQPITPPVVPAAPV